MKSVTKIPKILADVTWYDARTLMGISLHQAVEYGLTINHTYGVVVYKGKDGKGNDIIIVCTEYNEDGFDHDFTIIPKAWVIEIKEKQEVI